MKKSKIILVIIILLIITAGFIGWNLFGPTIHSPESKFFYIRTGSSFQDVANDLTEKKIISSSFLFNKVANYLHYDKAIKPGKYKISEGTNIVNLVRMLRAGNQSPVNLSINKLRTKEDLAKKLGDNFESDSLSFINFLNNPDSVVKYKVDTNTIMTIIIPNTYSILWNATPTLILKKLYSEQEKFWTVKRKEEADRLHFTTTQTYILASIVEEETNKDEDKGKIASVYINRMNTGMKLGADPTVKFAMKDFALKRIYYKHLSYVSPYNTYLNPGLPPGPICAPSIKTIDAVLNAPSTDYFYFVARPDFSGYSNFASGYAEHMRNAKAYQQALDSIIRAKQQVK